MALTQKHGYLAGLIAALLFWIFFYKPSHYSLNLVLDASTVGAKIQFNKCDAGKVVGEGGVDRIGRRALCLANRNLALVSDWVVPFGKQSITLVRQDGSRRIVQLDITKRSKAKATLSFNTPTETIVVED